LPWWQQRAYVEGLEEVARQQDAANRRGGRGRSAPPQPAQESAGADMESRFNVTHVQFGS
jgi:hypothetical protein